jgi:hypothetical protein
MTGLRHRMSQETHGAMHASEADRCRMEFDLKSLEEELATRSRITRGEDERIVVRKGLYDSEIDALHNNLNKSIGLIAHDREYMHRELADRKVDGQKVYQDLKASQEQRVTDIKNEYEKAKEAQRGIIAGRDDEIAGMPYV